MNTVKKITLISLITAFMCCTIFCVPTSALLLNDEVTSIEYLDNGDRIETVISYKAPDTSSVTVNSSTKTATKTKYYKNSNGAVLWSVSIKGTFSYNGSSSKCTSCSHSTTAPSYAWSIKSASHSKSGNTATAKATATQKTSTGTKDFSMSVTIKCSSNGTIS